MCRVKRFFLLLACWFIFYDNVQVSCFATRPTQQGNALRRYDSRFHSQSNRFRRKARTRSQRSICHSKMDDVRQKDENEIKIPAPEGHNNITLSHDGAVHVSDTLESIPRGGSEENDLLKNVYKNMSVWPSMDDLDRSLIKITVPCIANFAISPLIGAVDLFWVSRMGNALAVAGQAAANQVFNSAFWVASFLPSVTATLVAKEYAKGDKESLQDAVCQAMFLGIVIALVATPFLFFQPERVLSAVLKDGAPAMAYAEPYLLIRSFAFLPSILSAVGFSAFRGVLDTVTPVKISSFSNLFNAIFDPILIFTLRMGVPGAALATLAAELVSAVSYVSILFKKQMVTWTKLMRVPSWYTLQPLIQGGAALQLRNFCINITFLAVQRVTQSIDSTGVSAAAHAMAIQTFQIGAIVLFALSSVAQAVVPNEMVVKYDKRNRPTSGGVYAAKATVNRLMSWGFLLGSALGVLQIALLPLLTRTTPLQEVRSAAKIPSYLASIYQIINGMVFIGEGVMVGCGNFLQLSISTLIATTCTLWALNTFPAKFGLTGVWIGFGVFNTIRLAGVWIHQTQNGPLAPRNLAKSNHGKSQQ